MKQKKYIYGSQQYKTIRSFGDNIYTGKLNKKLLMKVLILFIDIQK